MHYTYNISTYELIVTLPGNTQALYKLLQFLDRLPDLTGIAREDTVRVAA